MNCEINWDLPSSLLRSLTHLELRMLPKNSKLNGKQYVDALKAMPSLEFLALNEALPFAMGSESVHLASLRCLFVRSINTEVVQFFHCVTFPPKASINVNCYSTASSSADFSGVITGLARSYSTPHIPTLATFNVASTTEVTLILSTAGTLQSKGEGADDLNILSLVLSWESSSVEPGLVPRVMNDIFGGGLPLRNISWIHLKLAFDLDPKTLANTFGRLLQVEIIMVDGGTIRSLVGALQPNPAVEDAQSIVPVRKFCFPSLSAIYIRNMTFRKSYQPNFAQYRSDLPLELLRDCLKQRNESCSKIKMVFFDLCTGLSQQDVKMLKDVVLNVECQSCAEE